MGHAKPVIAYKLRAAAVSFGFFLLFASLLTFFTYRYWFPEYLFWTDGGLQGLRLVCAVDLVLGPLLATVFFHPEKTRGKLLFDIAIITAVQLSAMAWGAYQVYSQRPLVVVYGDHRFISVAPGILALQKKQASDMLVFSPHKPPYAYRRDTVSEAENQKKTVLLMRYGIHFEAQAWLFEPLMPNLEHVFDRQQSARDYITKHFEAEWKAWVAARAEKDMAAYRFAVYEGRYENAMLIFSPAGEYQGYFSMGGGIAPEILDAPRSVDKAH